MRLLKCLMFVNVKRFDFINFIVENCCKVNELEGKKDVFLFSKCFSCRIDSWNWFIYIFVCIKFYVYLFEVGCVLIFVCLVRYMFLVFWDKNIMYYLMRWVCNFEYWFCIFLKGKLCFCFLLKYKKMFWISV